MSGSAFFDWGWMHINDVTLITKEIFVDRIYERYREVKENDIVMDIGANVGAFTASILKKKPKRIFAIEPSNTLINSLWTNTRSEYVTYINAAIEDEKRENVDSTGRDTFVYNNNGNYYNATTFKSIIDAHDIKTIDFMKVDCEGGEYSVFNEENREFILNNVKYIAGEWHFAPSIPQFAQKFRLFRDLYLANHKNFHIFNNSNIEVTEHIFNEYFMDLYDSQLKEDAQLMVYIINE
jgi:FkbM family methyltransferase